MIIFFLTALVSSCVRVPDIGFLTPGMWAKVDEEGWTSRYILFENGQVHVYSSGDKKYQILHRECNGASESDFVQVESHKYSIVDGMLHCADNAINISVGSDRMILGSEELYKFNRFVFIQPYIYVTNVLCDANSAFGGTGHIDYFITNPLYGLKVSVSAPEWIEIVNITDDRISFNVLPYSGNASRMDAILLSYSVVYDGESYDVQETVWIQQTPDNTSYLSLSSSGRANCYIVSGQGAYKFDAVQGNSSTSVGKISSAEVLWESFGTSVTPSVGDLIKYVSYANGSIAFQTSDTFKEGNAVIAAKDASGKILWSWHIWFTDQPQAHVYNNNAGTMMDRNLGATSATPGDVGALGLLYQWGRKDPFLGSSSISSNSMAKSTITWPSAVSSNSSSGTIGYATSHPTTFISSGSDNSDWYYTGDSSTDNTRWTTSESTKSIYDPCPADWRVPDGGEDGVWSTAEGYSSSFRHDYNDTNEGINFSGTIGGAATIWYPASGSRYYHKGGLNYVGNRGYYWSASPSSNNGYYAYYLSFDHNGVVNLSVSSQRASGYSVRCVRVID